MIEFKDYPRKQINEFTVTHAAVFTERESEVKKLKTPLVMKKHPRLNAFERLIHKLKIGFGD